MRAAPWVGRLGPSSSGSPAPGRFRLNGTDLAIELDRTLQHRDVTGAFQDHQRGIGQLAGQRHRGGRRRDAIVLTDHDERGDRDPRKGVAQVHLHQPRQPVRPHLRRTRAPTRFTTCSTRCSRSVGTELREPDRGSPKVAGLANTALRTTVDALGRRPEPSRGRSRLDDRAQRRTNEVGRGATHEDQARDPRTEQLGRCSARAIAAMPPMLWPTTTAGRSGATTSSTAPMSRPSGSQRQVPVRGRAAPPVPTLIHQHASEVRGQVDPLLVPGRHVQAEPVDEQQHRRRRIARRHAPRSRSRRTTRPRRGRPAAGPTDGLRGRARSCAGRAFVRRRPPRRRRRRSRRRSPRLACGSRPLPQVASRHAGPDPGHDLVADRTRRARPSSFAVTACSPWCAEQHDRLARPEARVSPQSAIR